VFQVFLLKLILH